MGLGALLWSSSQTQDPLPRLGGDCWACRFLGGKSLLHALGRQAEGRLTPDHRLFQTVQVYSVVSVVTGITRLFATELRLWPGQGCCTQSRAQQLPLGLRSDKAQSESYIR